MENQLIELHARELLEPMRACLLDVGPVLLGGEEGLFLSGNPSVCVARQTVGTLTFLSNAPASSPNVMSGIFADRLRQLLRKSS